MKDNQGSVFTPKDWTTIRVVFRIYVALILVTTIAVILSPRPRAWAFHSGLMLIWLVTMGLGFFYLVRLWQAKRPWYWLFVLNILLLFVSYVASALALPVFAATFANLGSHRPAPSLFLLNLSIFMRAWPWVLLTVSYAMLGLSSEALNKRYGPPTATRGLRWLMAGQIIFLVALGGATLLAQRSIAH